MKESIFSTLRDVKLWGIKNSFDLARVMTVELKELENKKFRFAEILQRIKIFIFRAFWVKYTYQYKNNTENKYLFIYGKYWYREDHKNTFVNFTEKFDDADVVCAKKSENRQLKLGRGVDEVIHGLVWFLQIVLKGIPIKGALLSLASIQCIYELEHTIDINWKKYKLCIAYSELTPDENYVLQKCKFYGAQTATMQHGIFVAGTENDKNRLLGIQLKESKTDFFLAWNEFTKDNAIQLGVEADKIQVLGIPKYINDRGVNISKGKCNKVFGVVLNGYTEEFDKQNIKLVQIAERLGKELGYNYVLRYHPDMKGNEYSHLVGINYLGQDDNKTSIKEYAGKVEFTLMACSSVFIELLYLRHPTYRLRSEKDDAYALIEYNSFGTLEELNELVSGCTELDNKLFDYVCTTRDVYAKYREFIDSIIFKSEDYICQ